MWERVYPEGALSVPSVPSFITSGLQLCVRPSDTDDFDVPLCPRPPTP